MRKPSKLLALSTDSQYINKDFEEVVVKWLKDEESSELGLTWKKMHDGLTKVAEEHGHTLTDCMWHDFKYKFNEADKNKDGVINLNELEVAYEQY